MSVIAEMSKVKAEMANFSIEWKDDTYLEGIIRNEKGESILAIDRNEDESFELRNTLNGDGVLLIDEQDVLHIEHRINDEVALLIDGHGIDVIVDSSHIELISDRGSISAVSDSKEVRETFTSNQMNILQNAAIILGRSSDTRKGDSVCWHGEFHENPVLEIDFHKKTFLINVFSKAMKNTISYYALNGLGDSNDYIVLETM